MCQSVGPWPAPWGGWSWGGWRWEQNSGCTSPQKLSAAVAAETHGAPAPWQEGTMWHVLMLRRRWIHCGQKLDRLVIIQYKCNSRKRKKEMTLNLLWASQRCILNSLHLLMSYHLIIWNQRVHIFIVVGLAHPLAHLWVCIRLSTKTRQHVVGAGM